MKHIVFGIVVGALTLAGCSGKSSSNISMTKESDETAVAGITWSYPSTWQKQGARMMRAATYTVPSGTESAEAGECAVFFFGSDQGGDAPLNIERWKSQFEDGNVSEQKDLTVGSIKVTVVDIEGTYLAPAGMMMQSTGKKENHKLLGAIISAPGGMVFFKLTAPKAVADDAKEEFEAMVNSITAK